MDISTALVLAIELVMALWLPYAIFTSVEGRHMDTPGSRGGSRGAIRTSDRTRADLD